MNSVEVLMNLKSTGRVCAVEGGAGEGDTQGNGDGDGSGERRGAGEEADEAGEGEGRGEGDGSGDGDGDDAMPEDVSVISSMMYTPRAPPKLIW